MAEKSNIPVLPNFFTTGPAKLRPTAIMPLIKASTNIAETPVFSNKAEIRWFVPNSVEAVKIMQNPMKMNNGVTTAFHIDLLEIPNCTRSVFGNC